MTKVPNTSILRDMRFSLEENWEAVQKAIDEAQKRGLIVTPLSVFFKGELVGWYLDGWEPPPPIFLWRETELIEELYDYNI